MKLLCFGNEYVKEDSLVKEIADELPGFDFVKCESPDEILNYDNPIIIDVVKGISKITLIEDIDQLQAQNLLTLHDFDLGYFLKLMKETGMIDKVRIIGVPMGYDKGKAKEELKQILNTIAD